MACGWSPAARTSTSTISPLSSAKRAASLATQSERSVGAVAIESGAARVPIGGLFLTVSNRDLAKLERSVSGPVDAVDGCFGAALRAVNGRTQSARMRASAIRGVFGKSPAQGGYGSCAVTQSVIGNREPAKLRTAGQMRSVLATPGSLRPLMWASAERADSAVSGGFGLLVRGRGFLIESGVEVVEMKTAMVSAMKRILTAKALPTWGIPAQKIWSVVR